MTESRAATPAVSNNIALYQSFCLGKHKILIFLLTTTQTVRANTVSKRMAITDTHPDLPGNRILIVAQPANVFSGPHVSKGICSGPYPEPINSD